MNNHQVWQKARGVAVGPPMFFRVRLAAMTIVYHSQPLTPMSENS